MQLLKYFIYFGFFFFLNQGFRELKTARHLNKIRSTQLNAIKIALTREQGNNDKLASLLSNFECLEIPCIAFGPGKDTDKLESSLLNYDLITVTSPQVNI